MKIKIAAGCQNESATNAVISAVGPREEPFIGKFYKISHCAVTNIIWKKQRVLQFTVLHAVYTMYVFIF